MVQSVNGHDSVCNWIKNGKTQICRTLFKYFIWHEYCELKLQNILKNQIPAFNVMYQNDTNLYSVAAYCLD